MVTKEKHSPDDFIFNQRPIVNIIRVVMILYVAGVLIMTFWTIDQAKKATKIETENSLNIVLQTTDEALEFWLFQQREQIGREAERQIVIDATQQLLETERDPRFLTRHHAQADLRAHFEPILGQSGDLGIFVIAPDYISLASMRDENVGTANLIAEQRPDLLERVFQGETLLIPPVQSDVPLPDVSGTYKKNKLPTMFIATPIRGDEGQIIAVLTFRIDPSSDFSRIAQLGNLGETGETYAFDKNGILMTESRFTDQLIEIGLLELEEISINRIRIANPGVNLLLGESPDIESTEYPLTTMAQSALMGIQGTNVDGYLDYRGVEVYGAWLWDEILGVGLATEIDAEEALAPYYRTRRSMLNLMNTTLFVSILLAIGLLYVRWRRDRDLKIAYQALQKSEQQNRSILENTVDAIISIDENNLITSFNRAAERMFGYNAEEVLGNNVHVLMPEPDHSEHEGYVENYINSGNPKVIGIGCEVSGLRKDGSQFPMNKGVSEFYADGERYFTSVMRDISLEKEAEQAIQTAREAAEKASLTKTEFLSNVSHELRTPLNSLMGVAYLAEESELSPFQNELLDKLKSTTGRLKSIIDTILDFSSLREGELEIVATPFNIHSLLHILSDVCAPKAYEKGLGYTFNIATNVPPNLVGDPDRLDQVLAHLTENAIKFTEVGEIEVLIELADAHDEQVTLDFSIHDTGIGMTEDQIFELFQPFTQLDGSSTRRYGGLGMGLILSKQIVRKMGGEISVESQPGKGSVFSFVLDFLTVSDEYGDLKSGTELDPDTLEQVTVSNAEMKGSSLDLEVLTPLFQDLHHSLAEYDTQAVSIINDLRKKISSPKLQPELKQLERLITLYEFEEGQSQLIQLADEIGISMEANDNDTDKI